VSDLVTQFEKEELDQTGRDLVERDTHGWPSRDEFKFGSVEYLGAVVLD